MTTVRCILTCTTADTTQNHSCFTGVVCSVAVLLLQQEWVWQRLHLSATLCRKRLQRHGAGRVHLHPAVPVTTGAGQDLQPCQTWRRSWPQLLPHLLPVRLTFLRPHRRWDAQRRWAHHLHAHTLRQPGAGDAAARRPRLPAEGGAGSKTSWFLYQH